MNIGERIKKVRQTKKLTQQELADKMGVKRNTIAIYETNRSTPSTAVIALICRTFQVNETWLRTGEGEMFLPQSEELILDNPSLDVFDKVLIRAYIDAPQELRAYMKKLVKNLSDSLHQSSQQTTGTVMSPTREEIAAYEKVRAFKENIQHHNEAVISENMKHLDDLDPKLLEEIEKSSAIYKEHLIQEARATNSSASSFTEGKSEK